MATRGTKLAVGLFVAGGIALGVLAILWFGASQYLKKGKFYDTFFPQSVGAISKGSLVKYMGLRVGTVETIAVSPNKRLMEVVLKLSRTDIIGPGTVAEISTVGLTGVGYVELSERKPGEKNVLPRLGFIPEYPVIATRPGGFSGLLAEVKSVMGGLKGLDMAGISRQIKKTARTADDFFSDPEMRRTKARLEDMTAKLDRTAGRIEQIVSEKDFGAIPGDTIQTLDRTRGLVARAEKELEDMHLAETAKEVNNAVKNTGESVRSAGESIEDASGRARVIAVRLEVLIDSLRQASDDLDHLLERLDNNPSELIWSKPVPPGRPGKTKKDDGQ
ncbi:MAG: MlaD family protein [Nitrospiraceae bacterium]|nr:MlaD family protein [Nitrospiraceae bacterium]